MEIWELNPFVRYMDQRTCSFSYEKPILAYDYRLFAVREGSCSVEVENGLISGNKNDVIILPPAVPYRMIYDSRNPASLYDINFSLGYVRANSLTPEESHAFDPARMPELPDETLFSAPMLVEDFEEIFPSLHDLLAQHERGGEYSGELCAAILKVILVRLLQKARPEKQSVSPLIATVQLYLEEHCREAIEGEQVGRLFGYHPFYLNRLMREQTGWTMHRYQMECRMKRACSMLANTRLSVREIADSLGFAQPAYFSELFRQMRDITPTEYRKKRGQA